jgi:hypothetical protein
MTKIFIAGSMSIKHLDSKVKSRIDNIIDAGFTVLVGDADGVDFAVQMYLHQRDVNRVIVYCSGAEPRRNVGDWPVRRVQVKHARSGSRAFFTAKDVEMAKTADFGLMIWDAKSVGTLRNVIELLCRNKKSVVFINTAKQFRTIGEVSQLENLMIHMDESALRIAEVKIGLRFKISELLRKQFGISD